MNQTFKQKAIVAALSTALAISAGVASANQFADTTITNTNSQGTNVAKAAQVNVAGVTVAVTEALLGSISTGNVVFSLDNSAKFAEVTLTTSSAAAGTTTIEQQSVALGALASINGTKELFTFEYRGVFYSVKLVDTDTTLDTTNTTVLITSGATAAAATASTTSVNNGGAAVAIGAATVTGIASTVSAELNLIAALGSGFTTPATTNVFFGSVATGAKGTFKIVQSLVAVDSALTATTNTGINASGDLVVKVTGASSEVSTFTVSGLYLDASASALDTAVNVSLSKSTSTGVTSANTTKIATVKAVGATVATTATAVPSYPKGAAASVANYIKVSEAIAGAVKDVASATDEIVVTLPAGFDIITAGAVGTDSFTTTVGTPSGTSVTYNVGGAATSTAGSVILGTVGTPFKVVVPSTAATGNVDATVVVKLSDGTSTTSTVTLFKVADKGTANTATDSTGAAFTTYATLYAGRSAQDTTATIKVAEIVGDSLIAGGNVIFTLPTGVTAGKNYTATEAVVDGVGVTNTVASVTQNDAANTADEDGTSTIKVTLSSTDGSASVGNLKLVLNDVDLADTAAAGDLNVTLSGNSGVTAGTVKVAEIVKATNASVSGATPVVIAGTAISLPEIVITEAKAGALTTAAGGLGLYAASLNGALLTGTSAKVKAYKADGTDVSATILGNAAGVAPTFAANGQLGFVLAAASTASTTGPVTFKINGVSGTVNAGSTGDITAVVGGTTTVGNDTTPTSAEGALAFKQTIKLGAVVPTNKPYYPTVTVADLTKAVITGQQLVAAGDDQGKAGAVYVAVIFQGNVFFLGANGTWVQFTTAASVPAYATGTLGSTTLNVLPTAIDLTPIKGAQLVAGYGIGIAGLSSPFDDFIKNARYGVIYEVK